MCGEGFIAEKKPYAVDVEAGKTYFWCSCGCSYRPPFCDGSHVVSDKRAMALIAERSETVYLCGCKETNTPPFCDGTHSKL